MGFMVSPQLGSSPCPPDCPNRKVGCHNPATCKKWAIFEAKKQALYAKRADERDANFCRRDLYEKCHRLGVTKTFGRAK